MLEHSKLVLLVDRFQAHSPEAVSCMKDPEHGKLAMHGEIKSVFCGTCGSHYPLTPEFLKAVTDFK